MKKAFDRGRTPRKTIKAVFPSQYKVRDLVLHPLNTNSFTALDILESPLLCGKVKLRFRDLVNALFVCSRTPDQLDQLMALTEAEVRMACAAWSKNITPDLVLESPSVIVKMIGEALSTYVAGRNPK